MKREDALKQMKTLKSKAKKARKDGVKAAAAAFRQGAKRLERKIRGMPKPVEAPAAE